MSTMSQMCKQSVDAASAQHILLVRMLTEDGRGGFHINTPNPPPAFLAQGPTALLRADLGLGRCTSKEKSEPVPALSPANLSSLAMSSYHTEVLPSHCFFLLTCLNPQLLVSWQLSHLSWAWPGFTCGKSAFHTSVVFASPAVALVHKINEIFTTGVLSRQFRAANCVFIFQCQMRWHNQK